MGLWVGSYEAKGGAGLYPLVRRDGHLIAGEAEPRIANASFAVWSRQHQLAYFVDEQDQGRITAWRHDGAWQSVGEIASGGALPCYLALSHDERWLACANYGDGTIAVFRIDPETGAPVEMTASFRPDGETGPDPERQDGPHAHCVVFAEQDDALYHVDLGCDRVFRHTMGNGAIVQSHVAFEAPAGAGPRHLVLLSGGDALLVCELAAQLLLLRPEQGRFATIHAVPTAPEPTGPDNLGGHLMLDPCGDVLVTNRGHDSVVRFALAGDRLERLDWSRTGGSSPRHLLHHGERIVVAHEESGGVTSVRIGLDQAERVADIPGAAFILGMPD